MRNTRYRLLSCACSAVLVFIGVLAWGTGNAVVAAFDFCVGGLNFGVAVGLARQGRI